MSSLVFVASTAAQDNPPGLALWISATGEEVEATPQLLARGEQLYGVRCAICHGHEGDGNGPAAVTMTTKPRDFTRAIFKYRTTDRTGLPSDQDFYRTITAGFPAHGMPAFHYLSNEDRWALVHYTKSLIAQGLEKRLRKEFAEEGEEFDPDYAAEFITRKMVSGKPIMLPPEPEGLADKILSNGPQLYLKYQCDACHGKTGRGDGPSAAQLKDDWGFALSPRDLREPRAYRKAGWRLEDTARITFLGIPGATMPSFVTAMTPEELWILARYSEYLREGSPPPE